MATMAVFNRLLAPTLALRTACIQKLLGHLSNAAVCCSHHATARMAHSIGSSPDANGSTFAETTSAQ